MIKKITMGILAVALTGSLYAENYSVGQTFIGVELGSTEVDSSARFYSDGNLPIEFGSKSNSNIEYGFRLGAQNDEWRTTVLYTYYDDEDSGFEDTMHKGSLNLDYFIWSTDAGGMKIKPFIGGHVGYMSYESSADTFESLSVILADESGAFYGGQAGVALAVAEMLEIDLSYRYSFTDLDDISASGPDWYSETSVDNVGSIVFGLNYFF